ncbi:MAG: hypothetical protein NTV01_22705 [Bacteroidia bacterium]|nr:hypothetical protein [Bacteroidia bacterium]
MKYKLGLCLLVIAMLTDSCDKNPFAESDSGTFKDSRDNQEYSWIRIGEQIWMSENLAWFPAVNPSANESETSPYYYIYGYQGSVVADAKATTNYTSFGVLYNWQAAKNACPSDWQRPTAIQYDA